MSVEVIVTLAVGVPTTVVAVLAYSLSRTEARDKARRQLVDDLLGPLKERLTDLEQETGDIELTHSRERRQLVEDLLQPIKQRLDQIERDIRELRNRGTTRPR